MKYFPEYKGNNDVMNARAFLSKYFTESTKAKRVYFNFDGISLDVPRLKQYVNAICELLTQPEV